MANIVCIDTETVKLGICEVSDVVAIHDDDVELTGPGYDHLKIIYVEGKTAAEVNAIFNAKRPEQRTAQKLPVSGQWCFLEEKPVWKNSDDKWCGLIELPKYTISIKNLSAKNITDLANAKISSLIKDELLNKALEKIHLKSTNNTEVADLNK